MILLYIHILIYLLIVQLLDLHKLEISFRLIMYFLN